MLNGEEGLSEFLTTASTASHSFARSVKAFLLLLGRPKK